MAEIAFVNGNRRKALDEYRNIYTNHPDHMDAFRVMRDVAQRPDFSYMKYDSSYDDVDMDDLAQWNDSRANAIYVLDIMVQEYHDDGTFSQYIHQAVKIMNQQGMDDWSEIVIPKDNVEILMARTLTPEGNEWAVSNVQQLNNQQSLSMYGAEPGAIVEYAYLQRAGSDEPGMNVHRGGYYFASDDDPMLLSKLTIVKPESLPFHMDLHPRDFQPQVTRQNDKVIYQWENRNQDGLKSEDFSPPLSKRAPTVHWTTSEDFSTLLSRYEFSIWGYEEDSPLVEQKAREFQEVTEGQGDYIKKVYTWIRDNIEASSGGYTTADTLVLQTGGPFQKLHLARHLLREAGIKCHLAVAFPTEPGQGYGPLPDISFGGEATMILLVPKQEGISDRVIFDFRSQFMPYNRIDSSLLQMVALVFDGKTSYLEPIDANAWQVGVMDKHIQMQVQEDGNTKISGEYIFGNLYDLQIRQALTNPEVKQRFADQQLSRDFRGIQLETHSLEEVDNLQQHPRLTFNGSLPDFAKSAGFGQWLIEPILDKSQASTRFVTGPEREFPMEFNSPPLFLPLTMRIDLSYFIENGYRITLPENAFILTQYGSYSLTSEWDGTDLVIRRSFLVYEQDVSPEEYEGFVEFCKNVDEIEEYSIQIQK